MSTHTCWSVDWSHLGGGGGGGGGCHPLGSGDLNDVMMKCMKETDTSLAIIEMAPLCYGNR